VHKNCAIFTFKIQKFSGEDRGTAPGLTRLQHGRLLYVGDYTVEQSWEQITVKFFNRDFFSKFVESLTTRYTALRAWNDPRRQPGSARVPRL